MFSKALFKQSCKANGTMWAIITFAVCFMLACVMLISGSGNISSTKNAIQDTIIVKEIDAQLEKRSINYYSNSTDGLTKFDGLFAKNASDALTYHVGFSMWLNTMPKQSDFEDMTLYAAAMTAWKEKMPSPTELAQQLYAKSYADWQSEMPLEKDFTSVEDYTKALTAWNEKMPATQQNAVSIAYLISISQLQDYVQQRALAIDSNYTSESDEFKEMLGSVMYVLNPNGMFDEFYTSHGEVAPETYDVTSILAHIQTGDVNDYLKSEERATYVSDRAEVGSQIFLAGNMTQQENVDKILTQLSSFGVTKEKYDSFGYTYESLKHMAGTTIVTYRNRLVYELDILTKKYDNGEFKSEEEYKAAIEAMHSTLVGDISDSFLSSLPSEVSDALEEIGKIDLYSLIVGSIFYKLAGLLLPIIYMIMAANNLIAGQVDTGSMAYVLSTSTKRKTVVFTQALYLIGSLLAMFVLTTLTGVVCLSFVSSEIELTYGKLILLNVGAFLVLFALSGLCFLTSCYFDRSKRSMAIGGGLSIFSLVAAMLGLFGSPVIPSVVRLDSLNYFNYTTIISFFDAVSIISGSTTFLWKFAILIVLGIAGYIFGALKFTKKDLPL